MGFKKELKRKKYNCTLPWIQSMIGEISYKNSSEESCGNENDFDNLFLEGVKFSKQIAQYNNSECPGNVIAILTISKFTHKKNNFFF